MTITYTKEKDSITINTQYIHEQYCTYIEIFYNGTIGIRYTLCFSENEVFKMFEKVLNREGYTKKEGVADVK